MSLARRFQWFPLLSMYHSNPWKRVPFGGVGCKAVERLSGLSSNGDLTHYAVTGRLRLYISLSADGADGRCMANTTGCLGDDDRCVRVKTNGWLVVKLVVCRYRTEANSEATNDWPLFSSWGGKSDYPRRVARR